MDRIEITYDGKPAITSSRAATRYDRDPVTMRQVLSRLTRSGAIKSLPEGLDDRTPLYLIAELDAAMAALPGRGNRRTAGQE